MDPSNILSKMFDYFSGANTSDIKTDSEMLYPQCQNSEDKVSKSNTFINKASQGAYSFRDLPSHGVL